MPVQNKRFDEGQNFFSPGTVRNRRTILRVFCTLKALEAIR